MRPLVFALLDANPTGPARPRLDPVIVAVVVAVVVGVIVGWRP